MVFATTAQAQVKEYYVRCDPAELENIYDNYDEDIYIPVTITYLDQTITDVRMRIRGDGTRVFPKKSLKFKFDKEPFFNGRETVNINAEYEDKTLTRQYLASRLMEESGQTCFSCEHVRLYINDEYRGLYLMIENVDEEFLSANDLDKDGNLYKATYIGACLSIWDDVHKHWEKKTNENGDHSDLQDYIDTLNSVSDSGYYDFAHEFMNYDEMVNLLALNNLLANGSTYNHNYYMYHNPATDKWSMLPWDMDKTFARYGYWRTYTDFGGRPDNPYFERAMTVDPIYIDIQNRIKELSETVFNNEHIKPIRDSLIAVLRNSVIEDKYDNVEDEAEWLKNLDNDFHFVKNRYSTIVKQYGEALRSFKTERTDGVYTGDVQLVWHPCMSPRGKDITYKLIYSTQIQMIVNVKEISDLTDTTYTFKAGDLPEGKYWWRIEASDGEYSVGGVDNFNEFVYKRGTKLCGNIESNSILRKRDAPFLIDNCDLKIMPGVSLTIEAGVEIRLSDTSDIYIFGEIHSEGNEENPVIIRPMRNADRWQKLSIIDPTGPCDFTHTVFDDGRMRISSAVTHITNCQFIQTNNFSADPIFKVFSGSFYFNDNIVLGNDSGEGILLSYSKAYTMNNIFRDVPDAIEYVKVSQGEIRDNLVTDSPDDGIDMNGCENIIVSGNRIFDCADKGISAGHDGFGISKDIIIERNLIVNCSQGICVKSGSTPTIINNTLYNNYYGINCFKKMNGTTGGKPVIINTIIAGSRGADLNLDAESVATVSYSLSDTDELPGTENIKADPGFADSANFDFSLKRTSVCINAGDPIFEADSDGTRSDIGAFYYNTSDRQIVINEINYNNAPDFDPEDWLEFYNPNDEDVDISNWYFSDDNDANKFVFPTGTIISSNEYLVLCKSTEAFSKLFPNVKNIIGDINFGLSSGGEHIRLFNTAGEIIDSLTYNDKLPWPEKPDGEGQTLELISADLDNSLAKSWAESGEAHGSPGKKNSPFVSVKELAVESSTILTICPNPVKNSAEIKYNLEANSSVSINISDIQGRIIMNLIESQYTVAGEHSLVLDKKSLAPGIYLCRIEIISENMSRVKSVRFVVR
ncbi:MAG: CotH kinase family protein [Candidatus Kapabacteria bacterium]|nr:CotH kinase family protein [Candidatus Kapabacteria bacterium]